MKPDQITLLAATVPDFAGHSFSPPSAVAERENGDLVLLGADGRKVVFTPEDVARIVGAGFKPAPPSIEAPALQALPIHSTGGNTPRPSTQKKG
jgi:hypothetical protein